MSIVVSHPTGNSNVRAVIAQLAKEQLLHRFFTTLAFKPHSQWLAKMPASLQRELARRAFDLPPRFINTAPVREIARLLLPRLGYTSAIAHETGWASIDQVFQSLDRKVATYLQQENNKENIAAVYAYEDGALATFQQAKAQGIRCIYDLPIAYWETVRTLLEQEAQRLPEWAPTMGGGIKDSPAKLERKTKELELADVVVTPSQFVARSLPFAPATKPVIVSPFGSPMTAAPGMSQMHASNRPLRVLFVGSMGQRKGLADLFAAVKLLNTPHIELVVLGSLLAPMSFYRNQLPKFTYEPGRPHAEVLQLMQSCDVFCLPSVAEGRALVMQEAMSQGLPVVITPNTGGDDLIIEQQTGFLVPVASPEVIAGKLQWFLDNRDTLPYMSRSAQAHAATYTWEKYAARVTASIENNILCRV